MEEELFDELDPCCQREIEERRNFSKITKELRSSDRSNVRLDARNAAIGFQRDCPCCQESSDYPTLARLRNSMCKPISTLESRESVASGKECEDSDNDDDSLLDDLDEFMSEYEKSKLEEAKRLQDQREFSLSIGVGSHRGDSIEHVLKMIDVVPFLVLHLYDPHSLLSAQLDLVLEELAALYLGTFFRRIVCSSSTCSQLQEMFALSLHLSSSSSSHLICFQHGNISAATSNLRSFGDDDGVFIADVRQFCDHAGVLQLRLTEDFLSLMMLAYNTNNNTNNGSTNEEDVNDDEKGPTSSYCNDPKCQRRFPHEHVAQRGGTLTGAANSKGSEALAKNELYRL